MTIPADAALLQRNLNAASGHIRQAISNVEGLAGQAGRPGAEIDALYNVRRELKHQLDVLGDLIDAVVAIQ